VIFSQSSDLMERQSSMASSTEEMSGPNNDLSGGSRRDDAADQFGVFKDFDFLEYESESVDVRDRHQMHSFGLLDGVILCDFRARAPTTSTGA
jgi:hypothetical protein